jgi:hypothetical protein
MVNLVVVHPSVPANTLGEFNAPVIEKSGIKVRFQRTEAKIPVSCDGQMADPKEAV